MAESSNVGKTSPVGGKVIMMQIEPNQPQPYPPIKCRDSKHSISPFPFSLVGEGVTKKLRDKLNS